jgi:hypothetical protein
MPKTPYSDKTKVLAELWSNYRESGLERDGWREFFTYYDFTLTLSYFEQQGWVTIKGGEAEKGIQETWDSLCNMLGINEDAEYNDIAAMFAASPNVES